MRGLGALDLGLGKALAGLRGGTAAELDVRGGIVDDHAAVRVALDHRRRNLERAHEGAGDSAVADIETADTTGLGIEIGVGDVPELLAGGGLCVHALPHHAGVPVDAQALARGVVQPVALAGQAQRAVVKDAERVPGKKRVGALDHADDVRPGHKKTNDLSAVRREDRHMDLAELSELDLVGLGALFLLGLLWNVDLSAVEIVDAEQN